MPTLIVEDGTEVSGANTYITLVEYETFISDRGLTDSRTDALKQSAIILSKDWVEDQQSRFSGTKRNRDNALVWPRINAFAFGYVIDSDDIPQNLKNAQAQLTIDQATEALYSIGDGQAITKEKVDVIEVEYSDNGNTNVQKVFAKADEFLKPLYKNGGVFSTIRV